MPNKNSYTVRNKKSSGRLTANRLFLIVIGVVLVLILGYVGYRVFFNKNPQTTGMIPSAQHSEDRKTELSDEAKLNNSANNNDKDLGSASSNQQIIDLAAPSGTFVSSHEISLSQSPNVASTCNTTPGAKCSINFINNQGDIRYLTVQTVDKNGATYWNWSPQTAGLTVGSWTIRAYATAGDQTKKTIDPMPLVIKP